ncbi:redoxin family protein [Flavivirga aquimarina]|uniref:Redoxin family protein n=1 Tax=Flavivirga aquimarina TaxID=2027862 RepID=A0ABT8W9E6_9FLAO|nr:redoxin family protein [Flavivirga aquimarina]MDO5969698.1 redoxin family protein [Flavivirga aquimarina]
MRIQRIFIAILIIGLIGCSKKNDKIIISGKINGSIPDKIEFTVPVDGTWFYGTKKSVEPDSLGNFTISMKSDLASFVTLYIPKQTSAVLLVEPGKEYEIDFDLTTKDKKVNIKGTTSSQAQNLYNSFALPEFHVLSMSNELLKDSILSSISSKINTRKQKELTEFQKQLEKQKINKKFYDLAELDRKYYYSALEAEIAAMRYKKHLDSTETQNAQILGIWKRIFEQTQPTDSFNISTPWSFPLMESYINVCQLNSDTVNFDNFEKGKIHSYNINKAKKYLKGKSLEYYYATYILSNSYVNKKNSKELIMLYENFNKEYPNSSYTEHLIGNIQPIIDFHRKISESSINNEIKYVENYKNINTFEELIKILKGKKVFVDIWGTWCTPCKKEFQYKDSLNALLKSKNMETLYICEGRVSEEKIWKEMIKFYNLEGYHIRANKKLLTDVIKKLERVGSFYYPYYILIDENGEIVKNPAKKPSQLNELKEEINKSYVW